MGTCCGGLLVFGYLSGMCLCSSLGNCCGCRSLLRFVWVFILLCACNREIHVLSDLIYVITLRSTSLCESWNLSKSFGDYTLLFHLFFLNSKISGSLNYFVSIFIVIDFSVISFPVKKFSLLSKLILPILCDPITADLSLILR